MNLQQVSYYNLPDHHDRDCEAEPKSHMVVEFLRVLPIKADELDMNEKIMTVKCYIPADVWRRSDGTVVVCYEHYKAGCYDPYLVYSLYDENNMPNVYRFASIGIRECLILSLGTLLGYDEKADCFRPFLDHVDKDGNNVYEKWYDLPMFEGKWKMWTDIVEEDYQRMKQSKL